MQYFINKILSKKEIFSKKQWKIPWTIKETTCLQGAQNFVYFFPGYWTMYQAGLVSCRW